MKICEMVKPEIDFLLAECNFTKEQREIFVLFSQGYTNEETAEKSNLSVSTVKRIKNQIKTKIELIKSL